MKTGKSKFMGILLFVAMLFATVIYSAFSTQLQIGGEAMLRAIRDIRITSIEAVEYNGDATEISNPQYTVDTTRTEVNLPPHTYITYNVTITNKDDVDYIISQIQELSHTSSAKYEISIKVNKDIIDYAPSASEPKDTIFTIKISNDTEETLQETLYLQYTFKENIYRAFQLSYNHEYSTCEESQCAIDELKRIAEWVVKFDYE